MGSWAQVRTESQARQYHALLASSNTFYANATLGGLGRLLNERGGSAYIFTTTGPPAFQILLLLAPGRDASESWKIVNAVPIGDYDPIEAVKIAWRKIREVLDEKGETKIFGKPLRDYGDPKMNRFFDAVRDVCWELVADQDSENDTFQFVFERPPHRRCEDELFEGPRTRLRQPVA